MAKETRPQTYRISDEVDTELRRLAKIHGGIDKALRVLMEKLSPVAFMEPIKRVSVEDVARQPNQKFRVDLDAIGPELSSGRGKASTETFSRGPRQKGDKTR